MQKRGRLYKRKEGPAWWCWYYTGDGERRQRSTRCTDRRAAETVLRHFERDAADPADAAARKATMNEALLLLRERARRDVESGALAHATFTIYETKIGHIARVFGHQFKLGRLTASDVDRFIEQRRGEGVTDHTIKKELVKLGQALKVAKRAGIWAGDIDKVMPVRFEPKYKPRKTYLTRGELQRLLPNLPPDRAAAVAFIVAMSPRKSEMLRALRTDATPDATMVPLRGTKTERASRTVPVVLDWQKDLLRFALKQAEGTGGLLFTRWTNAYRDLALACRKAGVPRVSFNDLRRTHATWMRDEGVSPSNVGAMMGHTTGAMVERVYDGRTPELLAQRIEAELYARAPSSTFTPNGAKEGALCAAGAPIRCNAYATDTAPAAQIPRTPWTPETQVSSREVARPVRFELTTSGFEGRRSIQLSYGRV